MTAFTSLTCRAVMTPHGAMTGFAKLTRAALREVIVQLLAGLTVPRSPISPAGIIGRRPLRTGGQPGRKMGHYVHVDPYPAHRQPA